LQSLEQAQVLQEQGVILIELVVDEGLLEDRLEIVLFSWYEAWYEMEKKKTDRKRETRAAFIVQRWTLWWRWPLISQYEGMRSGQPVRALLLLVSGCRDQCWNLFLCIPTPANF
jgi:hypothetical protein